MIRTKKERLRCAHHSYFKEKGPCSLCALDDRVVNLEKDVYVRRLRERIKQLRITGNKLYCTAQAAQDIFEAYKYPESGEAFGKIDEAQRNWRETRDV